MCYVCKCFAWGLDFIQRVITFALSCIMFLSICIGCFTAIAAGIAYGYNYMLSEYFTISRTDLSVYVRRGQFNDKPDYEKGFRRRGDINDVFSSNVTDYQDTKVRSDSNPLSDTWRKALDTRKYAEKLTKYSHSEIKPDPYVKPLLPARIPEQTAATDKLTMMRRVYTVTQNSVKQTTGYPKRTLSVTRTTQVKQTPNKIVMRTFELVEPITFTPDFNAIAVDSEFYQDGEFTKSFSTPKSYDFSAPKVKTKYKQKPDIKISLKELSKGELYNKQATKLDWRNTKPPPDYAPEEVDEGAIVYKPV